MYPFSEEAAHKVAEKFAYPDNTIRELMVACFYLLEEAANVCEDVIEAEHIEQIWSRIAPRILHAVDKKDHALRMLKILKEQGGRINEDAQLEV